MSKHITWVDNLKGIGIILVVLGHMLPGKMLASFIYSFHMPLFFFLSGYLTKERIFKENFKSKFRSLMMPYIIAAILSFPIGILIAKVFNQDDSILRHVGQIFYLNGDVGWNTPLWFLVVLFITECIFSIVKKSWMSVSFICLFSIILGLFVFNNNMVLPFGIHIVFFVIPFYSFGIVLKKTNILERINLHWIIRIILSFCLISLVIFILNQEDFYISEIYHSKLGNYFLYYAKAIMMICSLLLLSVDSKKSNFLSKFSEHTLFILTTHYLFFYVFLVVNKFILIDKLFYRKTVSAICMTVIVVATYDILFQIKEKQLEN